MRGFELVRWGGILLAVAIPLALVTPELPQLRPWQWAAIVLVGMGLWWSSQRVSQRLPKASLAALLLLVGLLASFVSLTQNARVWRAAFEVPGRSDIAALSPAADRIATIDHTAVGASGCLALWDVRAGRLLHNIPAAANSPYWNCKFLPDGNLLATGGDLQQSVAKIDFRTGKIVGAWQGGPNVSFSAHGERFVANFFQSNGFQSVPEYRVHSANSADPILAVPYNGLSLLMKRPVLSPSGRYLLVAASQDVAELWDVDRQLKLGAIAARSNGRLALEAPNSGMLTVETSLGAFSRDENRIAISTQYGVDIWNIRPFRRIGSWRPDHLKYVMSLDWAPQHDRLAVSYAAKVEMPVRYPRFTCILSARGEELASHPGDHAKFAPDGERLAIHDDWIRILDGATGRRLTRFGWHLLNPRLSRSGITFSADGEYLLHSGRTTLWHRTRPEGFWGAVWLPSYWGTLVFATLLLGRVRWRQVG